MRYLISFIVVLAFCFTATCDKKDDDTNLCTDAQTLYIDAVASVCTEDATCQFCDCDPATEYMATVIDGTTVSFSCEALSATVLDAAEACAGSELLDAEACTDDVSACAAQFADAAVAACTASIDASN